MDIRYPQYMKLSERELHNTMMKQDLSLEVIRMIKDCVITDKKALRALRIQAKMHARQWANLHIPLNAEILRVKASLAYKGNDSPLRRATFSDYLEVLLLLRSQLHNLERPDAHDGIKRSPAQMVRWFADQGKHVPHDGIHWADWVAPKIKRRIYEAFAQLDGERKVRAKSKEPFERKLTRLLFIKLREEMSAKIEALLRGMAAEHAILKTEKSQARLVKLRAALSKLNSLPDLTPIPRDWSALTEDDFY